ncbi:MAG: S8 family serine peptidase [Bacteroidota bacterium]
MTRNLFTRVFPLAIFMLVSIFSHAQRDEIKYIPRQFYFKLVDEYPLEVRDDPEVNIEEISFFKPYVDFFGAEVSSSFYFAYQYDNMQRTLRATIKNEEQAREFMDLLTQEEEVEYVHRIPMFTTNRTPDDDYLGDQWHLEKVKAEEAWDISTGGEEVIVAVVDNGFQKGHPDLQGKMLYGAGADVANMDDSPYINHMDYWHGTHVSGIVGADTDNAGEGVSSIGYNVKILPVKATPDGFFDPNLITHGIEGIVWAATNGANIINLSWGMEIPYPPEDLYRIIPTMEAALLLAKHNNILVVAAAGNDSTDTYFYPAAFHNVLAVANTDFDDKKAISSNYGTWVDLSAPGEGILSTMPMDSYDLSSGTSMSAPLVSGIAALMLSADPTLTPDEIIKCLKATADDIDGIPDNAAYVGQLGAGRVNAYEALMCVTGQEPETEEEEEELEPTIASLTVAPNPMESESYIDYEIIRDTKVHLYIYNRWGSVVAMYESGNVLPAGVYRLRFTRGYLQADTYICRLITSDEAEAVKIVIVD